MSRSVVGLLCDPKSTHSAEGSSDTSRRHSNTKAPKNSIIVAPHRHLRTTRRYPLGFDATATGPLMVGSDFRTIPRPRSQSFSSLRSERGAWDSSACGKLLPWRPFHDRSRLEPAIITGGSSSWATAHMKMLTLGATASISGTIDDTES